MTNYCAVIPAWHELGMHMLPATLLGDSKVLDHHRRQPMISTLLTRLARDQNPLVNSCVVP